LAATARVMARRGPAELTLGEIADEAGLTAGALVQRFGSKRGLLLTLAQGAAEATEAMFTALRAQHKSPLAALRAYADCFAQMGESPGGLAHHLAYLQIDLTDPAFRRHTLAQAKATSKAVSKLLEAAVAAGELSAAVDPRALARTIQVTLGGSLIMWAFYREGRATRWVHKDLDLVLRPFCTPAPQGKSARAARFRK
jgi:AcrR family transcriptional regulator